MKWYRIRAKDTRVYKPDGAVLEFWLWSKSENKARERCNEIGILNIESIDEDEGLAKVE